MTRTMIADEISYASQRILSAYNNAERVYWRGVVEGLRAARDGKAGLVRRKALRDLARAEARYDLEARDYVLGILEGIRRAGE